jgi:hypothetical protein
MKKKMGGGKKIPRWYLYSALIYAILGIIDSIILLNTMLFVLPFTIVGILWLLLNAGLLLYFKEKYSARAIILPAYYIIAFFASFILVSAIRGLNFIIGLQLATSVFELFLVGYFFRRR